MTAQGNRLLETAIILDVVHILTEVLSNRELC